MPVSKKPFERYERIHEILQRRSSHTAVVKFKALAAELEISERMLSNDIKYMREELNVPLEYDNTLKGWRYSEPFEFLDLGGKYPVSKRELLQLRIAIEMLAKGGQLRHFTELPGTLHNLYKAARRWTTDKAPEKSVYFDPVPQYDGAHHLPALLDAIDMCRTVRFDYQGFHAGAPVEVVFDPYFLRHYDRRWYVGGRSHAPDEQAFVRVFPLERILTAPQAGKFFHDKPANYNAETYWKNIYGITVPPNGKVETVILSFTALQGRYFRSSPFYEPYQVEEDTPQNLVVSLQLIPNFDLVQKLCAYGPQVRVLAPVSLAEEVSAWLRQAWEQYNP